MEHCDPYGMRVFCDFIDTRFSLFLFLSRRSLVVVTGESPREGGNWGAVIINQFPY